MTDIGIAQGQRRTPPLQTRQTLLPFRPVANTYFDTSEPQQCDSGSASGISHPEKPPTHLPTEIWDQILGSLGTLALKTFRLVCRQWSVIGTPYLFSTVYVNNWYDSWSHLIDIATSPKADLVQRLVWNAVVLPQDCLDADKWSHRYQNLLRGLPHSEMLRFYGAFKFLAEQRYGLTGSIKTPEMVEAMWSLRHCRELVLSDDFDLETACLDAHVRSKVQQDSNIIYKPSTWSLKPRMWVEGGDTFPFHCLGDEMSMFTECASITSMTVDLWASHWQFFIAKTMIQGQGAYRREFSHPTVQSLTLSVKFCRVPWFNEEIEGPSVMNVLEGAFTAAASLPNLHELHVEPAFVEAGPGHMQFIRDLWLGPSNSDDSASDVDDSQIPEDPDLDESYDAQAERMLIQPTTLAADLVGLYGHVHGCSGAVINSVYAELCPRLTEMPSLRLLHLHNCSLNARLFLGWLCARSWTSPSKLSIHLRGPCVVYGLPGRVFLQALEPLRVKLFYDVQNLFSCPVLAQIPRPAEEIELCTIYHCRPTADFPHHQYRINWDPRQDAEGLVVHNEDIAAVSSFEWRKLHDSEKLHHDVQLSNSDAIERLLRKHIGEGVVDSDYTYCFWMTEYSRSFSWSPGRLGDIADDEGICIALFHLTIHSYAHM
ncbi:hypothetical protein HRR83_000592 [Exophiala dermatitidis]|uniref:F-box domain-containing protein n=1 Tax=Exophiala dermatitidis TaxID=5970 RepID=A0AAN6F3U9_EXODE|nr:hypothetical protein HRR74_000594 [Exophiala dermatitidis]KAJ4528474.1 hypothetical protein HRR73_001097 [Exophiala dermatitidis]KAJ4529841.1 hypothetical protein HRR76_009093 [Exophiala dermatitidis]KAJ4558599.1 hypothetical protein HRR77_000592 [Exophiala dermatitidis]KAJ4581367.1 hypothetical protein HRR79_000404 [Exophiala dermatitidis]